MSHYHCTLPYCLKVAILTQGVHSSKSEPLWVAPWVESRVHIALCVDWEGGVDSEESNMEQDGIELLHKKWFFAVSILGTAILDELMLSGAGRSGYNNFLYPHTATRGQWLWDPKHASLQTSMQILGYAQFSIWWAFCFLVGILFLAIILFLEFVQTVHMNFHAKSGLCSSKMSELCSI